MENYDSIEREISTYEFIFHRFLLSFLRALKRHKDIRSDLFLSPL